MGKRLNGQRAAASFKAGGYVAASLPALRWLNDSVSEWLCDYGESVVRVLRAFLLVLVGFALLYWMAGCLEPRDAPVAGHVVRDFRPVDYLLFSLDSMTTVGTSEVGLKPAGQLGVLLSSVQTVLGTVLLGLFGFVLGVRMRN